MLAQRQFERPVDLTSDSPLQFAAARVSADELILLFAAHHIAWDDGSWAPFFTDLARAYADSIGLCRRCVVADAVRNSRRRLGLLALVDDQSS